MKTLYLDCSMGAAGDMLTAALLELVPDKEAAVQALNAMGIPDVVFTAEPAVKCGITGTHMSVKVHGQEEDEHLHDHTHEHCHEHEHSHEHTHEHCHEHEHSHEHTHEHCHEHEHSHEHCHEHEHTHEHSHAHGHVHTKMQDVADIVAGLKMPDSVKEDVKQVYGLIAAAESNAHGMPVTEIHFHEVGTMDAIADVSAVCLLLHLLQPEQVIASPVHVGAGTVHCAHGVLPVPAPATAFILKGVPIYGGSILSELCTPTGAALLKHFVTQYGPIPAMQVEKIGYGMGKKEFAQANCVRAMLGETSTSTEDIVEMSCNVDDMTGEAIAFALEELLRNGATDVYTVPIGMKKGRPGVKICVLFPEKLRETMVALLLRHTTTLGVRETVCRRYTQTRTVATVQTPYGPVRRKDSTGHGASHSKYEYEDLAEIARRENLSLAEVLASIEK